MIIRALFSLPAVLTTLALSVTGLPAADSPITAYYGNTLLCQNQANKAICHLWLNPDQTYFVMYDRGVQTELPVAGGNFRIEARRGKYTVQGQPGAYQVCLTPDAVPDKQFKIEQAGEVFAGKGCYALAEQPVGSNWMQATGDGKQYKMWLVKGHG